MTVTPSISIKLCEKTKNSIILDGIAHYKFLQIMAVKSLIAFLIHRDKNHHVL